MLSSPMVLDISSNMKDNNGIVPNFNTNSSKNKGLHPLPSFFQLTDHICWIFDDHEEHIALVSQFCIDAVASNQAALVIFVDSEIQRVMNQIFPHQQQQQQKQQYTFLTEHEVEEKLLSVEGFNFQYYKDTEQIKFVSTRNTCFVDGIFSGEKLINLFKTYTLQATSQGYHGFRCCADMSFASLYAAGVEGREYAAFHYFESQLSLFIQEQPRFLKCCCYDRRICSPAFLQQVLMCHPIAAVGKEYLPYNFYFVPPHKSVGVVTANTVLDQWIDTLVTRKKLDRALEDKVVDLMAQVNALQAQVMENKRSVSTEELAELAAVQKSSFVASMSHELRTPLNGIATATALISTTPLTTEQLEYVEIIESSALHLQTVLRDVLDLCQMDSNKFEIDPIPVSIRGCLAHVKKMVNVSMNGAKRKEVVWEIADDVPEFICTDEHRLTQVLVNLISNSMKFTKHNGTIRISVTTITDRLPVSLRFQVCDDGVGIPKEVLESFFQHDYVRNSTTSLRFGGVGLGLTISKKLVEALGGTLSIESEGVDKGTVVTFTITESVPSSSSLSSSSSSSSSSPPSSPPTPPTLQQHEQRKPSFPTSSDSVLADSIPTALVPSYTAEQQQGGEQLPPPLRWLEPSHSPPLPSVVATPKEATTPQDTYMCTDDIVVVPSQHQQQQQQRADFLPMQLISQNQIQLWQFSLDSPVFVVPDSAHLPNSPTSTTSTTPTTPSHSFAPVNPSASTELYASGMFHPPTATSSSSHAVCRSNSSSALIPLSSSTTSLLPNVLLPQPSSTPTPTTYGSTTSPSSTSSAPSGIVKTNLTSLSVSLTKTLKILLVEDNVMNQKVCKRLLNKLGYQPLIVSNGLEAVNAVRENIFDIILMDLHMPVMDGFEATRVIQSMPVPKKPKIFALTASVSIADVKRCKEVGMVAHISKPISVENLLKVLRMEW